MATEKHSLGTESEGSVTKPSFPWAGKKKVASFSLKAGVGEEGGETNSTLRQPSGGWALVPIIYGAVLPV